MGILTTANEESYQPKSYLGVMVSSTFSDVREHRAEAIRIIEERQMMPRVMECDSAKPEDVIESSLQMVRDSAAYVGVITHKYGQTPICPERNPSGLSLTELEFNEAQRLRRPTLLFIMGERHRGERSDFEQNANKLIKLGAFRERAKKASSGSTVDRVYAVFESLDEFKDKAANAIANLAHFLSAEPARSSSTMPIVYIRSIDQQEPCPILSGRSSELSAIVDAVQANRTVIIAGGPGFGKTALAIAVLYQPELVSRFRERRLFVSFDSSADALSLLARLVDALGLPTAGDEPALLRQININLPKSPAVVILDNAETFLEQNTGEAERLLRLLSQSDGLTLIITARGSPPSIPNAFIIGNLAKLDNESAREAFLNVSGGSFDADEDLLPLLNALDGHALSIQLVAAQAAGLPRLALLRRAWDEEHARILRRPGESEGRLTSVRASLAISLNSKHLMEAPWAKRLLSILSYLPAGCAEDDVRLLLGERATVSRKKAADAVIVLHRLKLVERRLDGRLRMLTPLAETLKLDSKLQAGDRKRVIEHYTHIASLGELIGTDDWQSVKHRCIEEIDNCDNICLLAADFDLGSTALFNAVQGLGELAYFLGLSPVSLSLCAERYRYNGYGGRASLVYIKMGRCEMHRLDFKKARELGSTAKVLVGAKELQYRGNADFLLGTLDYELSNHPRALLSLDAARATYEKMHDKIGLGNCLQYRGAINLREGNIDLAKEQFEEALVQYDQGHVPMGKASILCQLSLVDDENAEQHIGVALKLFETLGSRFSAAYGLYFLGEHNLKFGDIDSALSNSEEARAMAQATGNLKTEYLSLLRLSQIHVMLGSLESGRNAMLDAFRLVDLVIPEFDLARPGWLTFQKARMSPSLDEQEKLLSFAKEQWEAIGRFDLPRSWIDGWPMRVTVEVTSSN